MVDEALILRKLAELDQYFSQWMPKSFLLF